MEGGNDEGEGGGGQVGVHTGVCGGTKPPHTPQPWSPRLGLRFEDN